MPTQSENRGAQLWTCSLESASVLHPFHRNIRLATRADAAALGRLFHAAFLGTKDEFGQSEADYRKKAEAIIADRYGEWLSKASFVFEANSRLCSACLVSNYAPYGSPVIAIIATLPQTKRSGYGKALLQASVCALDALGHRRCCAMITRDNTPSKRLFASCGFMPSDT